MAKFVSGIALAAGAGLLVSAAQPAQPTFCERLAPQIGLKPNEVRKGGETRTEWKSEQMGVLKKYVVGGTMMVSFGVQPGLTGDYEADTARAANTCRQTKKTMTCKPQAPDTFQIGTADGNGVEEVRAGESPVVEVRGTAVVCRDA